jgi:hypothetical protein
MTAPTTTPERAPVALTDEQELREAIAHATQVGVTLADVAAHVRESERLLLAGQINRATEAALRGVEEPVAEATA